MIKCKNHDANDHKFGEDEEDPKLFNISPSKFIADSVHRTHYHLFGKCRGLKTYWAHDEFVFGVGLKICSYCRKKAIELIDSWL